MGIQMHNPPHPGEFIAETYLMPFGISCRTLAQRLGVAGSTLSRILRQQIGVTPEMALRLSMVLGRSPESWLAMQRTHDLWAVRQKVHLSGLKRMKLKAPRQGGAVR